MAVVAVHVHSRFERPVARGDTTISLPTLILNFKNYRAILGPGALRLAEIAQRTCDEEEGRIEIIVAPPSPWLQCIASRLRTQVFSQRVEAEDEGKSTGAVIPEAILESGCRGSIINHSESRIPLEEIRDLVPRMRALGLRSCVCAETPEELRLIVALSPEFVAIEPPELIGSGIAVSKARPELVKQSVDAARSAGYSGSILCGAGIVSGEDVRAARSLGAGGVLVASSVVKSTDWNGRLKELARSLLD